MLRSRTIATLALAAALAACATPPPPPPPVVTVAPPPPAMPAGGYAAMTIPGKREDGTYITPNFRMTDAAAIWHLRGALNVAALACDNAGGQTVDGYNGWLRDHRAALDAGVKQYMREWEETGWADWQDAYDNNQTRLYNFYGQPAIRVAFCAAARQELPGLSAVPDAALPAHAREALARLDKPFIDFFTAFDAWRTYNQPTVTLPPETFPPAPTPVVAPVAEPPPTPASMLPPRVEVDPRLIPDAAPPPSSPPASSPTP